MCGVTAISEHNVWYLKCVHIGTTYKIGCHCTFALKKKIFFLRDLARASIVINAADSTKESRDRSMCEVSGRRHPTIGRRTGWTVLVGAAIICSGGVPLVHGFASPARGLGYALRKQLPTCPAQQPFGGSVPLTRSATYSTASRPSAASVRMALTEEDTFVRPTARGKRDIVFGTRITSSCPVAPKHDEGCHLGAYMQLPTDQYVLIPLPNKAKLEKTGEDLFTLHVPELQIFNVWLRPHVVSRVNVSPSGVTIEAVECRLDGSPEVQRLGLNDLFELEVKVVLQGAQDPRGLRSMMTARSEICVWVDAPQIFRVLFPRPLMVETGTAVLRSTLRMLQTTFLQGLAADYNKCAVDGKYRSERAK